MTDEIPDWGKKVLEELGSLKEQTGLNCSKLDELNGDVKSIRTDVSSFTGDYSKYIKTCSDFFSYQRIVNQKIGTKLDIDLRPQESDNSEKTKSVGTSWRDRLLGKRTR